MNQMEQQISSTQIKGTFDKKVKLKIASEEWLQSEIEYQMQQHDKLISVKVV